MHAKYPRRDVLTWILYGLVQLSHCVIVKLYMVLKFENKHDENWNANTISEKSLCLDSCFFFFVGLPFCV